MGSPEERITQLGRSRPEGTRTCTKGAYYLAWPYSSVEGDTPLTEEIYKVFCISRRSFLRDQKKNNLAQRNLISPNYRWGNQYASTHHLEFFRVLMLSRTTRSEPIL